MSTDSQEQPSKVSEELVRELRQCYGLGASFFRAAAARAEMTDTEVQVLDLLEIMGEATAGQLASQMGLTTGTFTAILNRLEKAGVVQRERDPNDGRRVIVKLTPDSDGKPAVSPLSASLGSIWEALEDEYDDAQKALLLEFVQRSNALAREEITRLRETPVGDEGLISAPLGDLESARLVISADAVGLKLRVGQIPDALYQAHFDGPTPDIKVKDGVVSIRYPRRLLLPGKKRTGEITLSTAVPWQIALKGAGADMTAELDGLELVELETHGSGSTYRVELPEPTRVTPIWLSGSGSEFIVRRPAGAAARILMKGWGAGVTFDDQLLTGTNSLQSANYNGADQRYDIETSGSGSMITISAG